MVARPVAASSEDRPISFFDHLEELRSRLRVVVYAFLIAFVVFLVFSLQYVVVLGVPMWLPLPAIDLRQGIAQQFFVAMRAWLVPTYVTPIVLTPWEPVIVQFKVALFLAILA